MWIGLKGQNLRNYLVTSIAVALLFLPIANNLLNRTGPMRNEDINCLFRDFIGAYILGLLMRALLLNQEQDLNQLLRNAGLSDLDIINHPVLSKYIDPLTLEVMQDPVRDNNGDLLERCSAQALIARGMGFVAYKKVISYVEAPEVKTEIENIVYRLLRK